MLDIDIKSYNRKELTNAYKKAIVEIKKAEYGVSTLPHKDIIVLKDIAKQIRDEMCRKDCINKGLF